jgi:hypothetical protein
LQRNEDGHLVEGGNVRIHAVAVATAAIKERNSVWTPGLTIVEVYRSVKACCDKGVSLNQRRQRPILADIGHFLLPLERVQSNSEYIRKTEFFDRLSSPPHTATAQQPQAFLYKIYIVITVLTNNYFKTNEECQSLMQERKSNIYESSIFRNIPGQASFSGLGTANSPTRTKPIFS